MLSSSSRSETKSQCLSVRTRLHLEDKRRRTVLEKRNGLIQIKEDKATEQQIPRTALEGQKREVRYNYQQRSDRRMHDF